MRQASPFTRRLIAGGRRLAPVLLLFWTLAGCAAPPPAPPVAPAGWGDPAPALYATLPPALPAEIAGDGVLPTLPPQIRPTLDPAPPAATPPPAAAPPTAPLPTVAAAPARGDLTGPPPTVTVPPAPTGGLARVVPTASVAPPEATRPPATPTAAPTRTPRPAPTDIPPRAPGIVAPGAPAMHLASGRPAMQIQDWPRPAGDNGRCMHWLRDQYFTAEQLETNLARLQQLGAKWVLVVYADENSIKMAAPRFAEAGIVPVWRRMLRPFERYYEWERDVKLVESYGLPPYFQVYNEPSLGQEWVDSWDGPSDEPMFLDNLVQASQAVYNAGGYVGWQFVSPHWLDHAIDEVERRGGSKLFERFFFVPHPYGENLPPDWTEDGRGVLSFGMWGDQLERRLGFRPVMIAGEGGWRINGQDEMRFPQMDEATHARYHVELFDWFRTGTLSDGRQLPDELLAYCPWLIAAKGDDNAWWDSFAGDRTQTIQAVGNMPPFERRFSWER